jgi:hypothetical protein
MDVAHVMSKRRTVDGDIRIIKSYSDLGKRMHGLAGTIIVNICMFIV